MAKELRYNSDGVVTRVEDVGLQRVDEISHQESYRVENREFAASYAPGGTLSRAAGSRTDASGRLIETWIGSRVDGNGDIVGKHQLSQMGYDELNRPRFIKRFEEFIGGVRHRTENFAYSPDGRITTITYSHSDVDGNLADRKIIETDASGRPIRITVGRGNQTFTATAEYNEAGQLIKTTDPAGYETIYTRDGLGRVLSRSDVRGTSTWTYDDIARTVTRTAPDGTSVTTSYNVHGQPVGVTAIGINFSFAYDPRGRVVSENWGSGSRTYTYSGSYPDTVATQYATGNPVIIDTNWQGSTGRLLQQSYGGKQIEYDYNAFNEVTGMTVRDAGGGTTHGTFTFDYHNIRGTLEQTTFPNEVITQYDWNLIGELTALRTFRDGEANDPIARYGITYDGLGRRTRISAIQPQAPVFPEETSTFTHTDGVLTAVGGQGVSADGRKNLTSIPGHDSLSYDLLDRVTGVGATAHTYDAARNRLQTTRDGETTRYLQNPLSSLPDLAATMNGSNQVDTVFLHGPGGLLGGISAGGDWQIAHQDFNANIVGLTDDQAQVTASYAYTPYGRSAGATGGSDFPFQFSGGVGVVTDEPEGLVHMRARSYSPEIRQFTSGDLIPGNLARPMSLGRYNFVEGMAMGGMDPSGLFFSEWVDSQYAAPYRDTKSFLKKSYTISKNGITGKASFRQTRSQLWNLNQPELRRGGARVAAGFLEEFTIDSASRYFGRETDGNLLSVVLSDIDPRLSFLSFLAGPFEYLFDYSEAGNPKGDFTANSRYSYEFLAWIWDEELFDEFDVFNSHRESRGDFDRDQLKRKEIGPLQYKKDFADFLEFKSKHLSRRHKIRPRVSGGGGSW